MYAFLEMRFCKKCAKLKICCAQGGRGVSLAEDNRNHQGSESNALCTGGYESQHRQVNVPCGVSV